MQTIADPSWEMIELELRSMDSFEKPQLDLMQDKDNPGASMLSVTGGDGVYHVQIANEQYRWCQAYDPDGPDEVVEVWSSDQGFEAPRNWTWPIDDAIKLVRYYYLHGKPNPDYSWF